MVRIQQNGFLEVDENGEGIDFMTNFYEHSEAEENTSVAIDGMYDEGNEEEETS